MFHIDGVLIGVCGQVLSEDAKTFLTAERCMGNLTSFLRVDEPGVFDEYVCERVLLAAILEQSFRDLSFHNPIDIKIKAIRWFMSETDYDGDLRFTFTQIVEELELSASQLKIIWNKVALAQRTLHESRPRICKHSKAEQYEKLLRRQALEVPQELAIA